MIHPFQGQFQNILAMKKDLLILLTCEYLGYIYKEQWLKWTPSQTSPGFFLFA